MLQKPTVSFVCAFWFMLYTFRLTSTTICSEHRSPLWVVVVVQLLYVHCNCIGFCNIASVIAIQREFYIRFLCLSTVLRRVLFIQRNHSL